MAQFARPDADVTVNLFTPEPLWQQIDEVTRSDADLIASNLNQAGLAEVGLSTITDPEVSTGHVVRYALRRTITNKNYTMVVRLRQVSTATTIAEWTHANPANTLTGFAQTLSGAQADSISDYADLGMQFDVTVAAGGGGAMEVSWAEFEVPDAAAPLGGSFTADAIIKRTQAGSFTADAVLKGSIAQSVTADAIFRKTQSTVTPDFACGAECQSLAHWSTYVGSPAVDTVTRLSGAASWRIQAAAAAEHLLHNFADATKYAQSFTARVMFTTLPDVATEVLMTRTAGSSSGRIYYNPANGFLEGGFTRVGGLGVGNVAIQTGVWYRIEARVDSSGATSYIDWNLDGIEQPQGSYNQPAHYQIGMRVGMYAAATADFNVDDFAVTQDWTAYPLNGYVDASDAWVSSGGGGIGITANAYISAVAGGSLTGNAIIRKAGISGSFVADAVTQRAGSGTIAADATVKRAQSGSFTADAVLKASIAQSVTADAIVRVARAASFTADASIAVVVSGSMAADAIARRAQAGSLVADAVIQRAQAGSVPADSIRLRTFYFGDGPDPR